MNGRRADDWQQRAETLERNAAELNELLVERSADLNERTRDLNSTAKSLREARSALTRSESDVASLARRQRQLANEKAQVEDEREQLAVQQGALEGVAGAYVSCNSGLVDLVGAVARDDWTWVDYYYDSSPGRLHDSGRRLGFVSVQQRQRMKRLGALALSAFALSGCGGGSPIAQPPPEETPAVTVPELIPVDPEADRLTGKKLPTLARDSAERRARTLTLRSPQHGL